MLAAGTVVDVQSGAVHAALMIIQLGYCLIGLLGPHLPSA